ncbi:MAG: hypothetical protein JWM80_93 [Cyanobacteria bacterium RYN_339]|nr:hypothetical protein [Cyanobacteria bacterium RYN_339]
MRRHLLAALAMGFLFAANPVQAASTPAYQVAAKATPSTAPSKKPGLLSKLTNLKGDKVAFNEQTKKFHIKGCRYYDGKNNKLVTLAEAKKAGGQPCQVCQKDKDKPKK